LATGDVVHLLEAARVDPDSHYVVDDQRGFCVVNPDILVSGTSVVSTLFCMRKAVLNEKFKGLEGTIRLPTRSIPTMALARPAEGKRVTPFDLFNALRVHVYSK
jgi:hypothetical protein